MIVADLENNKLVYQKGLEEAISLDMPDATLASTDTPMGCNTSSMRMVYQVQDGKVMPTCLEVYNNDYDPNGEELPGSPDQAREQNHYAQVMSCVHAWLTAGE